MKKHELLKYAYDNYPKGTKVKSIYDDTISISSGVFVLSTNIWCDLGDCSKDFDVYDFANKKWAEVVNPRTAVIITNEFEYNQVKKAFKELRFGYSSSNYSAWGGQTIYAKCEYMLDWGVNLNDKEYTAVSFQDFAKEHNIRIPLLVSEDGVDLFEGDVYFNVQLVGGNNKKWKLISEIPSTGLNDKHFVFHTPNEGKAFSTKQAALYWIEEANKPKEIIVSPNSNYPITVTKDGASIDISKKPCPDGNIDINLLEIAEINKALKQLEGK